MNAEQICDRVAALLVADGLPASAEQTGGWVYCVVVPEGDTEWYWGMADETWGGALEADHDVYLTTTVPSDSDDAERIATAIHQGVLNYRERLPKGGAA